MRKRLLGVINIKNGLAVQSFSYKWYLPLGSAQILVKNLDNWGADEIIINAIDRSKSNLGPDFETIEKINKLKISTPVVYGGGIRNLEDAKKVIASGADRIIIESLINKKFSEFERISEVIGSQSIIASIPLKSDEINKLISFNPITSQSNKIKLNYFELMKKKLASEILLIDYLNEGYIDKFNLNILKLTENFNYPTICMGGISSHKLIKKILLFKKIRAVALENSLNYKEISIQNLKEKCQNYGLRGPVFKKI